MTSYKIDYHTGRNAIENWGKRFVNDGIAASCGFHEFLHLQFSVKHFTAKTHSTKSSVMLQKRWLQRITGHTFMKLSLAPKNYCSYIYETLFSWTDFLLWLLGGSPGGLLIYTISQSPQEAREGNRFMKKKYLLENLALGR